LFKIPANPTFFTLPAPDSCPEVPHRSSITSTLPSSRPCTSRAVHRGVASNSDVGGPRPRTPAFGGPSKPRLSAPHQHPGRLPHHAPLSAVCALGRREAPAARRRPPAMPERPIREIAFPNRVAAFGVAAPCSSVLAAAGNSHSTGRGGAYRRPSGQARLWCRIASHPAEQ
jgi:hypothetical protein